MKTNKKLISFIIGSLIVLLTAACGGNSQSTSEDPLEETKVESSSDNVITLKLGHQSPEDNPYQWVAEEFRDLVEERTDGKVKIEIYPFRQLGSDVELMEQMQIGSLDFGVITGSAVSNFTEEMMVLDLPYIFEDRDHVLKYLDSKSGQELLKETEQANMITYAIMPRNNRHITNSKKPINKPEDLSDLKIRVSESEAYLEAYKLLGANVLTMNWGDTFNGLQLGSIDGQENSIDVIEYEKIYEVQEYVSKTGINFAFANLMASKGNIEKLPEDIQEVIQESAIEAVKKTRKEYETFDEKYTKMLEEKGLEFNEVEKEPFKELTAPVIDNFISKYGDEHVKAIQATK